MGYTISYALLFLCLETFSFQNSYYISSQIADDPLWYNKSIIRPSTSFTMAKDATSVLNGDSTVNVSQMSDGWFENLTQSENSKIIQETVKKNISNRPTNGNKIYLDLNMFLNFFFGLIIYF